MFTGIIESLGEIQKIEKEGTNLHFTVQSNLCPELKIDQSVCHNGTCLTVVQIDLQENTYVVTAIEETLTLSNLGHLEVGSKVNLERCLTAQGRVDGHFVQGHVDTTAVVNSIENLNGSWQYMFRVENAKESLMVYKGSITINGVSLTISSIQSNEVGVSIIPYTHEHTNFHQLKKGSMVNIEYDILGKYIQKMQQKTSSL